MSLLYVRAKHADAERRRKGPLDLAYARGQRSLSKAILFLKERVWQAKVTNAKVAQKRKRGRGRFTRKGLARA
jgi:hypothetical protein